MDIPGQRHQHGHGMFGRGNHISVRVFITTIPRLLAAAISTLSNPIPARPITLSLDAEAITSAVTLVPLLMTSASVSLTAL